MLVFVTFLLGEADVTVFKEKKMHAPVKRERAEVYTTLERKLSELPSILPVTLHEQPTRQSWLLLREAHSSWAAFVNPAFIR